MTAINPVRIMTAVPPEHPHLGEGGAHIPKIPPLTHALISATVHCAFNGRARIVETSHNSLASEIQAIIAATVHYLFDGKARVVAVGASNTNTPWAHEGRRDIFYSHRVR